MKEKITIMLTLISLIGLVFHYHYKTNVLGNENLQRENNQESEISSENDDIISPQAYTDDSDVIANAMNDNNCTKIVDEIDKMSFNEAFRYFYLCNNGNDTFTWNNNEFKLELLSDDSNSKLAETNDIINKTAENQSLVSK